MAEYVFDYETVRRRISISNNDKTFSITYEVPVSLKEDLDLLIEQDIGGDTTAFLDDCQEEEKDGKIVGYIDLSYEGIDIPFEQKFDYAFKCASQFDMLSQGVSLIS